MLLCFVALCWLILVVFCVCVWILIVLRCEVCLTAWFSLVFIVACCCFCLLFLFYLTGLGFCGLLFCCLYIVVCCCQVGFSCLIMPV